MRLPALTHVRRLRLVVGCVVAGLVVPLVLRSQQRDASRAGVACDYRTCAYNIIPAGLGLRVVRGTDETPVASLGFLWTRDISGHFPGEGHTEARAAVRTRRWAAVFTDVGLVLLATGAAGALADDLDQTSARLMMLGAASVGVSVPLQFAADKQLARAVWKHNAQYGGGGR